MRHNFRAATAALLAVTVFAGCGSGGATVGNPTSSGGGGTTTGGGGGGTSTPTPTPTPSPTGSGSAGTTGVNYHPGANSDSFAMNGTRLVTYTRPNQYPSPEPTQTVFESVTQSVAVTNPVTFDGNASAVDFKIAETDTQIYPTSQTSTDTLDDYYAFSNSITTGNFLYLGASEVFDDGSTASVINGPNDELADILPEASGATWSNMAGRTEATNDNEGTTSMTTYNDDGSYNGTITYPYMSDPTPNPSGTLTNVGTIVAKPDGSGTYTTPLIGSALQSDASFVLSAPSSAGSAGTISETTTLPPQTGTTSTPEVESTTIANWMPSTVPGSLYSESDVDNGPMALPSSCPVPTGYTGTIPNQIVETQNAVDPTNGYLDTTVTTTYDAANIGPVCIVVNDTLQQYYDFSGQNGFGFFSSVPQQITVTNQVLYLQLETLQAIARQENARAVVVRSANAAVARAHVATRRIAMRIRRLEIAAHVRDRAFHSRNLFRGVK